MKLRAALMLKRRLALALAGAHVSAVEADAKRRAPLRTGRLRDSIRAYLAGTGRGVIEATAPYANYLHEGTGIYGPAGTLIVIEPRGKRALHWPGAAHPVRRVRQRGIRPRDFLRHAVRMYFASLRAFAAGLRMEVAAIFGRNYMKLKEADAYRRQQEKQQQKDLPFGTLDKYFHCKANCEAAQLGYLAEAILASVAKEEFDLTIDNFYRALIGDDLHTPKDSIQDMGANLKGLGRGTTAPDTPCGASCSEYRPSWLPERLW